MVVTVVVAATRLEHTTLARDCISAHRRLSKRDLTTPQAGLRLAQELLHMT